MCPTILDRQTSLRLDRPSYPCRGFEEEKSNHRVLGLNMPPSSVGISWSVSGIVSCYITVVCFSWSILQGSYDSFDANVMSYYIVTCFGLCVMAYYVRRNMTTSNNVLQGYFYWPCLYVKVVKTPLLDNASSPQRNNNPYEYSRALSVSCYE